MSEGLLDWLEEEATADDMRPLARAWIIQQRKSELVFIDSPEHQLRMEALRTAIQVARVDHNAFKTLPDEVLRVAEKYITWLRGEPQP